MRVLDPTAPPPVTDPDPGPGAGALAGKTVGLRYDKAWETRLRHAGARVVKWEAGNRIGVDGADTFSQLGVFAADVDAALVGLGN